ncbi:NAD(P)-binding domain protein [Cordyceps fumosorosea ARSEF 2679]|uniref:NAD(P)-binding domain protein n=1 Tax=Cordyceps fumosorosea (strain ARSEF 2679) TaxID=1081104 RepID=A0A167LET4_CORFA|nr:NAD(P)-binding domain protein [Cordyceps fumosorosea ARSEF 2679]OAA53002.1 NAD(P)-binding domain protein [Cordyceps fumosorosea ARSEF 2679]
MVGDFPLSDKIVLVTGGGSGIGLAFCKQALSSGARVVIADLRLTPAAEELAAANKDSVAFLKCDVTNWEDLEAVVPFSETTFGDVPDVYAANAGIGENPRSSFWGDSETGKYTVLDINLVHPIKLTRIAIRTLLGKRKKGVVVVTSSIAGTNGHFGTPLYSASKHGVVGLVKSLAKAEQEANVKVVCVCPGLVATPLLQGVMDGSANVSPDSTLMEPAEIASRIKELVEQGKYPGGTALGVYRTGEAEVVDDGSHSLLEEMAPTDLGSIRKIIEKDGS